MFSAHLCTLPAQYGEGYADSLECLPCPAPMNAARLRYLRKHHPDMAVIATAAAEAATQATIEAVSQILTATQQRDAA